MPQVRSIQQFLLSNPPHGITRDLVPLGVVWEATALQAQYLISHNLVEVVGAEKKPQAPVKDPKKGKGKGA